MEILTLDQYKKYKGINSDKDDVKYTSLIETVNYYIPTYCNREFTKYFDLDKVEYFDGVNNNAIYPREIPIVSVTSLESSSDGGETYGTALSEYTDYIVDKDNGIISSTTTNFVSSLYAPNSLKLTYKAGFADFPEDLKLAAMSLVEYYVDEQYTPRKSLSGASVDYMIIPDNTARLPAHIRRILEYYRMTSI